MSTRHKIQRLTLICGLALAAQAHAWGPDGHHLVGAVADKLIAGSHAEQQVGAILGTLPLRDAAVWADCAKGVDPTKNYTYQGAGHYAECKIFENADEEAKMSDYVRRNDNNCVRKPSEESCHKQYHYADIAIQHDHYDAGYQGARNDDVVAAISAAVQVLQGQAAPAPFSFKDKREALLLLTHFAGDIHQPLHVGAVYLDAKGKRVNPDQGTFDPATETRGGNDILLNKGSAVKSGNLHAAWDDYPASLSKTTVDAALLQRARAITASSGDMQSWPQAWASDTVLGAQQAFKSLVFGPKKGSHWSVTVSSTKATNMDVIKKAQLAKAGKRLADLLQAIWP